MINDNDKNIKKYVYSWVTAVEQKFTQRCKSAMLQLKSGGYKYM